MSSPYPFHGTARASDPDDRRGYALHHSVAVTGLGERMCDMAQYLQSLVVERGREEQYYVQSRANVRSLVAGILREERGAIVRYPDSLYFDRMMEELRRIETDLDREQYWAPAIMDEMHDRELSTEARSARRAGREPAPLARMREREAGRSGSRSHVSATRSLRARERMPSW